MYKNLIRAMNEEHVTYTQIAELLGKRYQTISDTANGSTFFPKYDVQYLFTREPS